MRPRQCCYNDDEGPCKVIAFPRKRYCSHHIMYDLDEILDKYCIARYADFTQCRRLAFSTKYGVPLCSEHTRKRDKCEKIRRTDRPKPRKPRKPRTPHKPHTPRVPLKLRKPPKKIKSSATIESKKTIKKQKSPTSKLSASNNNGVYKQDKHASAQVWDVGQELPLDLHELSDPIISESSQLFGKFTLMPVFTEVLDGDEQLPLKITPRRTSTDVNETVKILEESDITIILNQIRADGFKNLFTSVYERIMDMSSQVLDVDQELSLDPADPSDSIINEAPKVEETNLMSVFTQILDGREQLPLESAPNSPEIYEEMLEESDLPTILNQLPAEAFHDLFASVYGLADDMEDEVLGVREQLPLDLASLPDSFVNEASKLFKN